MRKNKHLEVEQLQDNDEYCWEWEESTFQWLVTIDNTDLIISGG